MRPRSLVLCVVHQRWVVVVHVAGKFTEEPGGKHDSGGRYGRPLCQADRLCELADVRGQEGL